jgi:glucose/arabinose dehydrogenase
MRRLWCALLFAACTDSGSVVTPPGQQTPGLTLPAGFLIETIASVGSAREIAALPNGDLVVGTEGAQIMLVPNAEGTAGTPSAYLSFSSSEAPVQGVAFDAATSTLFIATQKSIFSLPWSAGVAPGTPTKIASVRMGPISGTDGDTHLTTSIAVAGGVVYAGVGSSCNACIEADQTRAKILGMNRDGSGLAIKATRFRNAIALAANPATGTLWAGGAGQDDLPLGHPYEFFDAVGLHPGVADYGWPACEENHVAYISGSDCSQTVVPLIESPAYSSWIGAAFYPQAHSGAHAFPSQWRGLYIAGHGSWHTENGKFYTPPRVAFVQMNGDAPATPVDWSDPSKQWSEFVGGFQLANGVDRIGRPTGVAVGSEGSLFIGDDQVGAIYRVRPSP